MCEIRWEWSDQDFENMGWHDSRLYSISLPREDFGIHLDIDYIFDSALQNEGSYFIAPCTLIFDNVNSLRCEIDSVHLMQSYISQMTKSYIRDANNPVYKIYEYKIDGNFGRIILQGTGFRMLLRHGPIITDECDLWTNRKANSSLFDMNIIAKR